MFTARGLQEQVLDTLKPMVEAVVKGEFTLLWRAMMIEPLTNSIIAAVAILSEPLEAEKDILPEHWLWARRGLYES
jgi:alpha-galactosidase/6-phospho-beta-glucosidase family protein